MKYTFLLFSIFFCLTISCANDKKMDNAENNKQDNTMHINDMHINDFKFIVFNVHLNHEQLRTLLLINPASVAK